MKNWMESSNSYTASIFMNFLKFLLVMLLLLCLGFRCFCWWCCSCFSFWSIYIPLLVRSKAAGWIERLHCIFLYVNSLFLYWGWGQNVVMWCCSGSSGELLFYLFPLFWIHRIIFFLSIELFFQKLYLFLTIAKLKINKKIKKI